MRKRKIGIAILLISILILAACGESNGNDNTNSGSTANGEAIEGLPNKMVWSVYDVGSGGYIEATAIANELSKAYKSQIRLLPSSSGVGRMQPMKQGTADIGRLGDEYQFAFEGDYEFATKAWGPQDLRVVWSPFSYLGFVGLEKAGIETVADLKGKKVPFIVGNHSVNLKTEAALAFADLTWDDVERIELSDYGGQADALKNGQIDIIFMNPTASVLYELESMDKIKWIEMDADDEESWARVQEIAPWVVPSEMDNGAGMSEENTAVIMGYGYPAAAYAEQNAEHIYGYVKAMDETYDKWKDAAANLHNWYKENVLVEPLGVPFHEGTIRFLEEEGLWTEEYQAKNDELVERGKKLQEAWEETVKSADAEGISEDAFPEYWMNKKEELVQ